MSSRENLMQWAARMLEEAEPVIEPANDVDHLFEARCILPSGIEIVTSVRVPVAAEHPDMGELAEHVQMSTSRIRHVVGHLTGPVEIPPF